MKYVVFFLSVTFISNFSLHNNFTAYACVLCKTLWRLRDGNSGRVMAAMCVYNVQLYFPYLSTEFLDNYVRLILSLIYLQIFLQYFVFLLSENWNFLCPLRL